MSAYINITNARVNNLKNVSLKIPKHKLTVITGLSGSGKSSLAFDTIYAEGQRRYAESLNAYARQFMDVQDKPDVDEITGLSPTIAIDQKNISQNPRSTVGTVTEIYDFLRLLFARIGVQYCPGTNEKVTQYSTGEIVEIVRKTARKNGLTYIYAPIVKFEKINSKELLKGLEQTGCDQIRLNGTLMKLSQFKKHVFDSEKEYEIDMLVGAIEDIKKQNILLLVEKALDMSNGSLTLVNEETGDENTYSTYPFSKTSNQKFDQIEPRSFSFNSPYGACPRCTGLGYTLDVDPELVIPNPRLTLAEGAIQPWTRIVGNQNHYQKLLEAVAHEHNFSVHTPAKDLSQSILDIVLYGTDGQLYSVEKKKIHYEGVLPNLTQRHANTDSDYVRKEIEQYMRERTCPSCEGKRLKPESLAVRIGEYSIADISSMSIEEIHNTLQEFFLTDKKNKKTNPTTTKNDEVAKPIIKEIERRLKDLLNVGLYYLTLDRGFVTLSGGEAQRIRLSSQLSTGLTDVIYILDEPSIGLHSKDNQKLIKTLKSLRDLGNTVIVVEHDEDTMEAADHVIDVGPGAGAYGGEIIAEGKTSQIKKNSK